MSDELGDLDRLVDVLYDNAVQGNLGEWDISVPGTASEAFVIGPPYLGR